MSAASIDVPEAAVNASDTPVNSHWVRRLWGYMARHRLNVMLAMGAAMVGGICQTIVPLVARQIVTDVVGRHHTQLWPWRGIPGVAAYHPALWPWLVLMLALTAIAFGAAYIRRYRGGQVGLQVQYDLRTDMHDHLQRMDQESLSRMPTGQIVARANSDSTLVQGLLNFFPIMSGNVLVMLLSVAVMFYLSPLLALVSVVIAPSLLLVSYRMRWRIFPATWDAQQREGELVSIVDEDLNGVRVVKAFGQEHRELDRIADSAKVLYGSQMRSVRLQARYQPLLEAVPAFGQVAILALGGWLALRHQITLGTFLAFSTYVVSLMAPARQLAGVLTIGQQARAGVERIFQLLDAVPEVLDPPDAIELPVLEGAIDLNDVHFHYRDGPEVLDGVDLHIAPGERVAIVGPSGAGKSTIGMLVSRFYDPQDGSVTVDGIDVRTVSLASLRHQVGIVFEDSFLFSDTVRANIAYGRPDASEADIEAAARAAQADGFIGELPRGYDTVVGERGLTLSGGQRQRIALARAILYNPRVLILDDATSAIDSRTEEAIHDALRSVMEGRTTLLVAHRRSTLHLADRIVVLEAGRIVEQGTHEELMVRSALYRSLLSGLENEEAEKIGDRIEALAERGGLDGAGTTAAAWNGSSDSNGGAYRAGRATAFGAPSIGPGLGGGGGHGGGGGWRMALAPTPELLSRVAMLPPVRDEATIDVDAENQRDPQFGLAKLFHQFRWPLLFGLLFVVIDAVAAIAGPVLIKIGIDDGIRVGSASKIFLASAVFFAIAAADMVDQMAETFITGRVAQQIMLSLRVRIWGQLQRLSLDYYETEMAGRIMTRMTTDVDQFESLIENGVLSALVAMVTFIGVGVTLVVINPELGLCTLSVVIPLAFATVVFRRRAAVLYDQARERIAIVNADFQESLSGVRESQTFVHEQATMNRFHGLGMDYVRSRVAAQRLVATYFPFIGFLNGVATVIVLGVGAGMVGSGGTLTAGGLIAFVLYVTLFFSPIQSLSQVFDSWQQTRVSVGRISELMQLDTRTPEADPAIEPGRLSGEIVLDDLRFAYPTEPYRPGITPRRPARSGAAVGQASGNGHVNGHGPGHAAPGADPSSRRTRRQAARRASAARQGPADAQSLVTADAAYRRPPEALRGIDLRIAPGETVALVGETGAGKSTVVKLLARFYDPDHGAVRIDGHNLRELDLGSFRHQLGYVPQEAFLFSGTVRDNIAYGRPEATDAEVEAAARAVGAHDFVAGLAGGYLHELPERGRSLSAGQRQLLALARAQLVDPTLLLLDEATSNLDLPTETKVAAAIERVSSNRTTVVIAHRLQTARAADRIIVLHAGRVAEEGTHDELLAMGGRYAAMWEAFETLGHSATRSPANTASAASTASTGS